MITIDIYSEYVDEKIKYVCDYIFTERLKVNYRLVYDITEFRESENAIKWYYGNNEEKADIRVPLSSYIEDFNTDRSPEIQKELVFNFGKSGFDFFASIFFLLARVEEYRDYKRDIHDRFKIHNSLLFKYDLFNFPVIDFWIQSIKRELEVKINRPLEFQEKYTFKSTLDIDQFYAYRHKPLYIQVGSFLRDLIFLNIKRVSDRFSECDPYDNINRILEWHFKLGIRPTLFILCASGKKYDKNIDPTSKAFASKLKEIKDKCDLAIHPSYSSNSNSDLIKKERDLLTQLTEVKINRSRQHYLRMSFPDTYRALIDSEIKEEHSMACHEEIGFRAGTSRPFYWFDLELNSPTTLRINPFSIMDVTLRNYMQLSPEVALENCKELIDTIRACEGEFCLLWHNSSFYEREGWSGWKDTYLKLLEYAKVK